MSDNTPTQAQYIPEGGNLVRDDWPYSMAIIAIQFGMVMFALLGVIGGEVLALDYRGQRLLMDMVEKGSTVLIPLHFILLGAPTAAAIIFVMPRLINGVGGGVEKTFHEACGYQIIDLVALSSLVSVGLNTIVRFSTGNWYGAQDGLLALFPLIDWGVSLVLTGYGCVVIWHGVRHNPIKWLIVCAVSTVLFFILTAISSAFTWFCFGLLMF